MIKRLLSAIGVFAAVALSGCSLFSPTIHVLDDYVYWEETEDARYNVYINGEKNEQSDNFVTIPTDCDVELTVETVKNGNTSGKVTVHRQADPATVTVNDEASFGRYVADAGSGAEEEAKPDGQNSADGTVAPPDADGPDVPGGEGTYDFRLLREGYSFDYTVQLPEGVFAVSPEVRSCALPPAAGRYACRSFWKNAPTHLYWNWITPCLPARTTGRSCMPNRTGTR